MRASQPAIPYAVAAVTLWAGLELQRLEPARKRIGLIGGGAWQIPRCNTGVRQHGDSPLSFSEVRAESVRLRTPRILFPARNGYPPITVTVNVASKAPRPRLPREYFS